MIDCPKYLWFNRKTISPIIVLDNFISNYNPLYCSDKMGDKLMIKDFCYEKVIQC